MVGRRYSAEALRTDITEATVGEKHNKSHLEKASTERRQNKTKEQMALPTVFKNPLGLRINLR